MHAAHMMSLYMQLICAESGHRSHIGRMFLLENPISATLLGIAFIALVAPFVMKGLNRFKASED